jgi:hypothetical protein
MVEIICLYCKKQKLVKECEFKRGQHKYCSRECYYLAVKSIPYFCINCGKQVTHRSTRCKQCDMHDELTKQKRANGIRGKKHSLISRLKLSEQRKGNKNPFFGKKHTKETKLNMSVRNSGKNNPMFGIKRIGKNSPNWKGGIRNLRKAIRLTSEYNSWRLNIFTRDLFTCRNCGINGVYLECHHIIPIVDLFRKNDITTLEQALKCNEIWNSNNALTLCESCHCKLDKHRARFGKIKTK